MATEDHTQDFVCSAEELQEIEQRPIVSMRPEERNAPSEKMEEDSMNLEEVINLLELIPIELAKS